MSLRNCQFLGARGQSGGLDSIAHAAANRLPNVILELSLLGGEGNFAKFGETKLCFTHFGSFSAATNITLSLGYRRRHIDNENRDFNCAPVHDFYHAHCAKGDSIVIFIVGFISIFIFQRNLAILNQEFSIHKSQYESEANLLLPTYATVFNSNNEAFPADTTSLFRSANSNE